MKNFVPKMWLSLTITIFLMGLIAIITSVVTGRTYRDIMIDSQRVALSELIGLDVQERLNDLLENSKTLGLSVHKSARFRNALTSRDKEALRKQLDSRFYQYFVTAGIIQLEKLYLFDKKLNLIIHSTEGTTVNPTDPVICNNLHLRAAKREGPAQLKSLNEICTYNSRSYHAVLVPVGGLIPNAYLQIVTDPSHSIKSIETELGMPISLRYPDMTSAYQSDNWGELHLHEDSSLLAEYKLTTNAGETVLHVSAFRDLSTLNAQLDNTQVALIIGTILITFLTGLLASLFLRKTTLLPVKQLQNQVDRISRNKEYLGEKISVKGVPEIVELASGFNQMTVALQGLYKELSDSNINLESEIKERCRAEERLQHAYDGLEESIKDRTADLQRMTEIAEKASHSKSEFLSHMSHELRTPLNAILGFTQLLLLKKEELTTNQLEQLGYVLDAGNHLLALINEVLDLAQIETGHLSMSPGPVAIEDVITDTLALIKPLAAQRNITVLYYPADSAAYIVNADESRFKQILLNLLTNAIKYNKQDGKVSLEVSSDNNNMLKFSITDTGHGLDADMQQKLFIPFSRLHKDTKIEGTGIGLTITKNLVELMHGEIGVTSQLEVGSTFWFTLPVYAKE